MRRQWAWVLAAALGGVLAVVAGTLSAHVAGDRGGRLLATAAQYAMYHALALLGLAALDRALGPGRRPSLVIAGALFALGILLFSGSLVLLAGTGIAAFGYVTPFGGTAFIAGWLALAGAALAGLYRRD